MAIFYLYPLAFARSETHCLLPQKKKTNTSVSPHLTTWMLSSEKCMQNWNPVDGICHAHDQSLIFFYSVFSSKSLLFIFHWLCVLSFLLWKKNVHTRECWYYKMWQSIQIYSGVFSSGRLLLVFGWFSVHILYRCVRHLYCYCYEITVCILLCCYCYKNRGVCIGGCKAPGSPCALKVDSLG